MLVVYIGCITLNLFNGGNQLGSLYTLHEHFGEINIFHFAKWLRHIVSYIVPSADVLRADDPCIDKVHDQTVLRINVLGSLLGHEVACNAHDPTP